MEKDTHTHTHTHTHSQRERGRERERERDSQCSYNLHFSTNKYALICCLILVSGEYYCINMILIAMATAFSALVINLHQGKEKRLSVPRFFLKVEYFMDSLCQTSTKKFKK